MLAYQASKRGGEIHLSMTEDERIELSGDAVVVMDGIIRL